LPLAMIVVPKHCRSGFWRDISNNHDNKAGALNSKSTRRNFHV
jgi:hypothetical protein